MGSGIVQDMTEFLGTEDEVMRVEQARRAFEIKRLSMKQTIKPIAWAEGRDGKQTRQDVLGKPNF